MKNVIGFKALPSEAVKGGRTQFPCSFLDVAPYVALRPCATVPILWWPGENLSEYLYVIDKDNVVAASQCPEGESIPGVALIGTYTDGERNIGYKKLREKSGGSASTIKFSHSNALKSVTL